MNHLFRVALSPGIVKAAVKIALVVGTTLNVINQGETVLHGGPVSWFHLVLNYAVPYIVASYSAARHELSHGGERGV